MSRGSRSGCSKSIYGAPPCRPREIVVEEAHEIGVSDGVGGGDTADSIRARLNLSKLFADYAKLVDVTAKIINKFFPAITLNSNVIADMGAKMQLSPSLFTRLVWAQRNKGTKYDATSRLHLTQLKDIYLEYDMDWTKDPVLSTVVW